MLVTGPIFRKSAMKRLRCGTCMPATCSDNASYRRGLIIGVLPSHFKMIERRKRRKRIN